MADVHALDRVIVVGGGVAGLSVALALAPAPVLLLTGSRAGVGTATGLAQGGLAAAIGEGDAPALHAADTLAAGAGLSDPAIARLVADGAPAVIAALEALGCPFDREPDGRLALGLEAAHSRARIVHAAGDATGRAVQETLMRAAAATPSIEIREGLAVAGLAEAGGFSEAGGRIAGVRLADGTILSARAVVLATGGLGALYRSTTNPLGATGRGLAMAARAGAVLRDMEFVQFHPTAIAAAADPMPLATEALRGAGAILVDETGRRFMEDVPGRELAPRDVVARAIHAELSAGRTVFLDARPALGARFAECFPSVFALCRQAGVNPLAQAIPVRPAAHYHMGGIAVDAAGRSSLAGLWALGEVASTGLHGANRLASNSLIEAMVFSGRIAADILGESGSLRPRPLSGPVAAGPSADGALLRATMEAEVGVVRAAAGLDAAIARLAPFALTDDRALVALFVAASARLRQESRGGHFRADFPQTAETGVSSLTTLDRLMEVTTGMVRPPSSFETALRASSG